MKSTPHLAENREAGEIGLLHKGSTSGKEPGCQCRRCKKSGFDPWIGKIPWRRVWQPTPVFLPGESHGQRSLAGYSPWGRKSQTQLSILQTRKSPSVKLRFTFRILSSGGIVSPGGWRIIKRRVGYHK